jgi:cyanate lyase
LDRADVTTLILSAKRRQKLTFNVDVEWTESEAGPRVRITLDGKFLPYQWETAPTAEAPPKPASVPAISA